MNEQVQEKAVNILSNLADLLSNPIVSWAVTFYAIFVIVIMLAAILVLCKIAYEVFFKGN